jgi:hypothetical protein
MSGSDDVPSTLSDQSARDDKLPIAAYRLKTLNEAQRRAIYQSVVVDTRSSPAAVSLKQLEVGMQLPQDARLVPLPADAADAVPPARDLQYHLAGNTVLLADPLRREIFAVIPPP